ncbi:MAG: ABC transporter permease [Erysipelotrichaceae bacterium]|nr:ABC transporter permease [Erysipelotrichaceae bacterium]
MKKIKQANALFEFIRIIAALLIAYAITLLLIVLITDDPIDAVYHFAIGPFTTKRRFGQLIGKFIPYLLTGTGMCFVYASNRFNLIGEGVYSLSGCIVAILAIKNAGIALPPALWIAILLIIGTLVGAAVGLIPALMREKLAIHEIVSSIMLNFALLYLTNYLIKTRVADTEITYLGSTMLPKEVKLTALVNGTNIHSGLFIGLLAVVVATVIFYRTSLGYHIRICGSNQEFAKVSGINIARSLIIAQVLGAAFSALGGAVDILGVYDRYMWTALTQMGFDGLLVAVLSKKKPQYVPLGAFLLAYMRTGATILNYKTDIPLEFVQVMQAVVILLIAAEQFLGKYKNALIFRLAKQEKGEKNV